MSPYVVPDHRLASMQLERNAATDKLPEALTPTFWAELTIIPFDSLVDPVAAELSSQESMDTGTTLSKLADPQPPHVPHKHFFFDDGNITFLVEGILYRVHRYFFCRDSDDFKDRLSRLPTQLESTPDSPPIIQLDDVKSVDFDAFLSVLYPQNFNTLEERSFEEWASILDLATRWGFTSIRNLAIRCLEPPTPLRRLILARKYDIEEWVNPALFQLCERRGPLSLDEARHMDFEDVVLVGSVREKVRSPILTIGGAGIRNCIQAWRSGESWPPCPAAVSRRPSTPGIKIPALVASGPPPPTSFTNVNRPPTSHIMTQAPIAAGLPTHTIFTNVNRSPSPGIMIQAPVASGPPTPTFFTNVNRPPTPETPPSPSVGMPEPACSCRGVMGWGTATVASPTMPNEMTEDEVIVPQATSPQHKVRKYAKKKKGV